MEKYLFNSMPEFIKFIYEPPLELAYNLSSLWATQRAFNLNFLNVQGQTYLEYLDTLRADDEEAFEFTNEVRLSKDSNVPEQFPCLMVAFEAPSPGDEERIEYRFIYPSDFGLHSLSSFSGTVYVKEADKRV